MADNGFCEGMLIQMSISNDKITALEEAMNHIEKQFGKGSVMRLGSTKVMDIEVIPTGCLALDIALGVVGSQYR